MLTAVVNPQVCGKGFKMGDSTKIEVLEQEILQAVEGAGGVESAVGSATLIAELVLILLDMFQNCGGPARAKQVIRRPNSLSARYARRKAANQLAAEMDPDLSAKDRKLVTSATFQGLSSQDDPSLDGIFEEAQGVVTHTLI